MKHFAALTTAFFVASTCAAPAQTAAPTAVNETFSNIKSSTSQIQSSASDSQLSAKADDASKAVSNLNSIYQASPTVSSEYLTSLQADENLLTRVKAAPNAPNAEADTDFVARDLQTKLDYARAQNGQFVQTLGENITVSVITHEGGATVSGYDVICNPRRFANAATPLFTFPNETSPAQTNLPPGIYTLKILKSGHTVATKDIELGSDGKTTETVDITVP